MEKTKRTAPLWITLVCLIATILMFSVTVLAYVQNYQVSLPFLVDITFVDSDLVPENPRFNYNTATLRYSNVTVTVTNYGSKIHDGVVDVRLITTDSVEIAYGNKNTGNIGIGVSMDVTVSLLWTSNYTAINLATATIQLQQTS